MSRDKSRYLSALTSMHRPVQLYSGNNPFNASQYKPESATDQALAKGKLRLQEAQIANAKNSGKLDIAKVNMLQEQHKWKQDEQNRALKYESDMAASALLDTANFRTPIEVDVEAEEKYKEWVLPDDKKEELDTAAQDARNFLEKNTLSSEKIKLLDKIDSIETREAKGLISKDDAKLEILKIAKESSKVSFDDNNKMIYLDEDGETKKDSFFSPIARAKEWLYNDTLPDESKLPWESTMDFKARQEKFLHDRTIKESTAGSNQFDEFNDKIKILQGKRKANNDLRTSLTKESLDAKIRENSKEVSKKRTITVKGKQDRVKFESSVRSKLATEIRKIQKSGFGVKAQNDRIGNLMIKFEAEMARYQAYEDHIATTAALVRKWTHEGNLEEIKGGFKAEAAKTKEMGANKRNDTDNATRIKVANINN